MNPVLRDILRTSLQGVHHPRYFESERGFQAELYSVLQHNYQRVATDGFILEQEYQKIPRLHHLRLRPDIIVHHPADADTDRRADNLLVVALKLRSTPSNAQADFRKLDRMIERLNYENGAFINIGNSRTFANLYGGRFPDRIGCFSVVRTEQEVVVEYATPTAA